MTSGFATGKALREGAPMIKSVAPTASLPPQADHPQDIRSRVPALLSIPETAAVLTLSRRSVAEMLADGRLKAIRLGRRRIIRRSDLEKLTDTTLN